ncbi:MAG: PAS domain S-box protein [Duodenibacillus sp.]|nr:PAS domain S-box protein [Duodenibacillus sp.]
MFSKHSERPFDDQLEKLLRGKQQPASLAGIYASVITLALVVVLAAIAARIGAVETERLHRQVAHVAADSVHDESAHRLSRLASDITNLQTVVPLCVAAAPVFASHPELLEVSAVGRDNVVAASCPNPSSSLPLTRQEGGALKSPAILKALASSRRTGVAVFSKVYFSGPTRQPFVDIVAPTFSLDPADARDAGERRVIGRVSLDLHLHQSAKGLLPGSFRAMLLVDGKPLLATAGRDAPTPAIDFRFVLPAPMLAGKVSYGFVDAQDSPSAQFSYFLAIALGFAALLVFAVFGILRYQWRQLITEKRLRARVLVQHAMSQSLDIGLQVTDVAGRILFCNNAQRELFGFPAEELIGSSVPHPFWPPEEHARLSEYVFAPGKQGLNVIPVEFEAVRKDGTRLMVDARIHYLRDSDGDVLGQLTTFSDITEAKQNAEALTRSQKELARSREQINRVLDALDASVSVIRHAGGDPELLFCNPTYKEHFGETAAAHLRLKALLAQTASSAAAEGAELYDDVTGRWFLTKVKPVLWTDGNTVEQLSADDITARRNAEIEVARQLNVARSSAQLITMGEMASSLAHELNQPLAAAQNYASASLDMLKAGRISSQGVEVVLGKIVSQTQRAGLIMKRIRAFAKRREANLAPVPVQRIVKESLELIEFTGKEMGMLTTIEIEPDLPAVQCDAIMIQQVLVNLLKNAMEASQGTGSKVVRLSVARRGGAVHFRVSDQGEGVSEEALSHLFDPFFTTKSAGLGIGLNLCRSIIETHQGRLWHEPNAGGGAVFCFSLPVAADTVQS